jgi:hypothetical protein
MIAGRAYSAYSARRSGTSSISIQRVSRSFSGIRAQSSESSSSCPGETSGWAIQAPANADSSSGIRAGSRGRPLTKFPRLRVSASRRLGIPVGRIGQRPIRDLPKRGADSIPEDLVGDLSGVADRGRGGLAQQLSEPEVAQLQPQTAGADEHRARSALSPSGSSGPASSLIDRSQTCSSRASVDDGKSAFDGQRIEVALVEQHRAEHRFLGLEVVRRDERVCRAHGRLTDLGTLSMRAQSGSSTSS